jgi:hypothetical protein
MAAYMNLPGVSGLQKDPNWLGWFLVQALSFGGQSAPSFASGTQKRDITEIWITARLEDVTDYARIVGEFSDGIGIDLAKVAVEPQDADDRGFVYYFYNCILSSARIGGSIQGPMINFSLNFQKMERRPGPRAR